MIAFITQIVGILYARLYLNYRIVQLFESGRHIVDIVNAVPDIYIQVKLVIRK